MSATYYDAIADGYDELHGNEQKDKCASIKQFFSCTSDDNLLDIGCGSGISTACWNATCTGIDPSEKLIAQARQKYEDIEFQVASAEKLPFADKTFTKITSVTAIQNFSDCDRALAEIRRVATDDAKIIISCLKASPRKQEFENIIQKQLYLSDKREDTKETYFICKNTKTNHSTSSSS